MHSIVIARTVVFFTSCIMSGMGGFIVGVIVTRRRARYWMEQLHLAHTKSIAKLVDVYELSKLAREQEQKTAVQRQRFPRYPVPVPGVPGPPVPPPYKGPPPVA